MFHSLIQSAHESGSELIVHIRGLDQKFRGTIRDVQPECFTLFHSGCCNGILWAFRLEDVLTCALVIPVPTAKSLEEPFFEADCSNWENEFGKPSDIQDV